MNVDITPLVNVILLLIGTIITAYVIPWIRNKTSAAQFAEISCWVSAAVEAAEQIYKGSGRGQEKKEYVLKFLEGKGFTIDFDSLDNLIEAAVFGLPDSSERIALPASDVIGVAAD